MSSVARIDARQSCLDQTLLLLMRSIPACQVFKLRALFKADMIVRFWLMIILTGIYGYLSTNLQTYIY